MSAPTKAEAIKKAQAMKFFVGYPEQWNDDLTPEVTSDNMLDAVTQLRQNALQTIAGLRQKNFNDHAWDVWASMGQFTTDNAFYLATANSLVILPAWITKPRFDTGLSDAMFYAFAVTFGHEFCHGFDAGGSEFDADGQQRDWWQPEDKAAFKAKQQILIELYNQLDAYPGQKANGEKTLVENMADYGGIELVLECYKQKLTEQGFRGEQFDEQIKKLFLAYAQSWKQEYERDNDYTMLKYLYERDGHSAAHNRVNGMMRLQDDWYRLFDVKPTDKLYLAPEDRVKIW
jgi:predicted metalloendopeptidase